MAAPQRLQSSFCRGACTPGSFTHPHSSMVLTLSLETRRLSASSEPRQKLFMPVSASARWPEQHLAPIFYSQERVWQAIVCYYRPLMDVVNRSAVVAFAPSKQCLIEPLILLAACVPCISSYRSLSSPTGHQRDPSKFPQQAQSQILYLA